jgi:ribonuclease HIII
MEPPRQNSFAFDLGPAEQDALERELRSGNYRPAEVAYARAAGDRPDCRIVLYRSGKCVAQGRGAADWVAFVLEPRILGALVSGYDEVRRPEEYEPHMGVDESGKGDFFGPLVIAAAYVDRSTIDALKRLRVRDSKTIGSDRAAREMARGIRETLGPAWALVPIGPRAYNRLYASMGNVNRILGWGHARAIENLLEKVPGCPRAVADQFGPEDRIRRALLQHGRRIQLVQRPRAESDIAVAAASVLARAAFVDALDRMASDLGQPLPKGASPAVKAAAAALLASRPPEILLDTAKCHFRTTDEVLAAAGLTRAALGPDGRAVSRPRQPRRAAAPGVAAAADPAADPAEEEGAT